MKTLLTLAGLGIVAGVTTPALASKIDEYPTPAAVPGNQPLAGTDAVLRKLLPQTETKTEAVKATTTEEILRQDLEAFRDKQASLTPDQAARAWLALADRTYSLKIGAEELGTSKVLSFKEVVAVLPSPASWQPLAQAIAAREPHKKKSVRDLTYLLLAHILTGKIEEQRKDVKALSPLMARVIGSYGSNSNAFASSLMQMVDFQAGKRSTFNDDEDESSYGQDYSAKPNNSRIPDLVTINGRSAATIRLRQLLVNSRQELNIPVGEETRQLARTLALELVPKLKVPQWTLAQSVFATQLFEAMEKRFITTGNRPAQSNTYKTARIYYVLGLIANNRPEEATKRVLGLAKGGAVAVPAEALNDLNRKGHARAINDFLRTLLVRRPELPFWQTYITVAAQSGRSQEMLAVIRKVAARRDFSPERLLIIRTYLYKALLAADRVEEGGTVLRQLLVYSARPDVDLDTYTLGLELARVGRAVNKPTWVKEGVKAVRENTKEGDFSEIREVIELLVETRRDAEAEKELSNFLARYTRTSDEEVAARMAIQSQDDSNLGALTNLAGIYHRRNQHVAVLELLEKAPWWGAEDLSEAYWVSDVTGTPLGYMAASALAATGKTEAALPILKSVLHAIGGYDPAYELLLKLEGEKSLPLLEELFARDRFEERPLIWKAELLRRAGKLDEAEKIVRQAITIDPSDGEQGKGNRMRVYAVLASILRDKGDTAQANGMQAAVSAIRMSEDADTIYAAGLLTRAIKMYERSLLVFADAYCIQSRVAVRLAQAGRVQEATEHYRRAFELMPDSFGRMESHCFGCEGAFQGASAEGIAERVFKQGLVKTPNKPQLHYLFGYLREEQGRHREALPHFRRATQLDRDYINAWNKLLEMDRYMDLSNKDRNAAVLNLIRLDPAGNHTEVDSSLVTDLGGLWRAQDAAYKKWRTVELPETLLPLTASAPEAKKMAEKRTAMLSKYGYSESDMAEFEEAKGTESEDPAEVERPSEVVSKQMAVSVAASIADLNRMKRSAREMVD